MAETKKEMDVALEVKRIIAEQLRIKPEELTNETCLVRNLSVDSLDVLGIVTDLEDIFEIHISDEELEKLTTITVGEIINLVENKLAQKATQKEKGDRNV